MKRGVIFAPEARADLVELYEYIAARSGKQRAFGFTERITRHCQGFAEFPERGTRRDDLWPGLRITGFEKRASIAFHVSGDMVMIDRILYGGRDFETAFSKNR